jgi:hypothetical protein
MYPELRKRDQKVTKLAVEEFEMTCFFLPPGIFWLLRGFYSTFNTKFLYIDSLEKGLLNNKMDHGET